jgi:hypothetical protein
MDQIELAAISENTSLLEALRGIRKGTRAVVVVRGKDQPPLLVTASDIMEACNDAVDRGQDPEKVKVATVVPAHRPALAPGYLPSSIHPSRADFGSGPVVGGPVNAIAYNQMFAKTDDRYAVHEVTGDTALVVTSSERLTGELRNAVTICSCVGNPVHRFEPWQLVVPGRCNKLHGVKVKCATIDDTP